MADFEQLNITQPNPDYPWFIDREACMGDSLSYINANTNYFGWKINEINDYLGILKTSRIYGTLADPYINARVIQNLSTDLQDGMYINYNSTGGSDAHCRIFANGTTQRFIIRADSGFVGIGNTGAALTPYDALDISGSYTGGNGPFLRLQNVANVATQTFGPGVIFDTGRTGDPMMIISSAQEDSRLIFARATDPYTTYLTINPNNNQVITLSDLVVGGGVYTSGYSRFGGIVDFGSDPGFAQWTSDGGSNIGVRISTGGNFDISTERVHNYRKTTVGGNQTDFDQVLSWHIRNGSRVGGVRINGTSSQYQTSSDHRLKEDQKPIPDALQKVEKLKPYEFIWKSNKVSDYGFFAHEAQEILPNAVGGKYNEVDESGKPVYQDIDYGRVTPLLTAAVQELSEIVKQQQETINQLTSIVNDLDLRSRL